MIEVTRTAPRADGLMNRTVVQIPEGKDPFEICNLSAKALGLTIRTDDPEHDAIVRARLGPGAPASQLGSEAAGRLASASSDGAPKGSANGGSTPPGSATPLRNNDLLDAVPFTPTAGVRETSLEAHRKLKSSGKLTAQQEVVMTWMRNLIGDATRSEIERGTGLKINAVCGRVNELIALGELRETRKRRCRVTGETVNALAVAP